MPRPFNSFVRSAAERPSTSSSRSLQAHRAIRCASCPLGRTFVTRFGVIRRRVNCDSPRLAARGRIGRSGPPSSALRAAASRSPASSAAASQSSTRSASRRRSPRVRVRLSGRAAIAAARRFASASMTAFVCRRSSAPSTSATSGALVSSQSRCTATSSDPSGNRFTTAPRISPPPATEIRSVTP